MKTITLQTGAALVLLVGCASAQSKNSATPESSKKVTCGIEGFTKSPSEHIVVELEQPFRVRSVDGAVTSEGGAWPEGISVLIELRSSNGDIKRARTDPQGLFAFFDVPPGEYCFKATADGWQSVVGVIVVSTAADPTNKVNFEMLLGV